MVFTFKAVNMIRSRLVLFSCGLLALTLSAFVQVGLAAVDKTSKQKNASVSAYSVSATAYKKQRATWQESEILPNVVVVKYRESASASVKSSSTLSSSYSDLNILSERKLCPTIASSTISTKSSTQSASASASLAQLAVFTYASTQDPQTVADLLSEDENIEYAEPYFIRQTFYSPSDTYYSSSWWLELIEAAKAWEITKGDETVAIGIVDTGVEWYHPDLEDKIMYNSGEIEDDGIDNDGNGYIDDYIGWDFGSADNYPETGGSGDNDPNEASAYSSTHGTHCAGIAAAATDNSIGVASIGFNTKIIPVKTSIDQGAATSIYYGIEGILYAAERGAKIISCSWGGSSYSRYEQEIINYVTEDLGALVVAASGNSAKNIDEDPVYPAAYKNVLSVGSVAQNDVKATSSNYGKYKLDVFAPGASILSTWRPETYSSISGTSMACPMVAGLAALVAAQYPDYTPQQIAEKIRVTADAIDSENPTYDGLLGKGRINAYQAVSESSSPSIRLQDVTFLDENDDGLLSQGEAVSVQIEVKNLLATASSISLTLASESDDITITQASQTISSLSTNESATVSTFQFEINSSVAENTEVEFTLTITANSGAYTNEEQFSGEIESSYVTLYASGSNVIFSLNGQGNIGYDDFPNNELGEGLLYDEVDMLYEGALILGTSDSTVEDVARTSGSSKSEDFSNTYLTSVQALNETIYQVKSRYDDSPVSSDSRLNVDIQETGYLFTSSSYTDMAIMKYVITNHSDAQLDSFHVGLLMDWDVVSYSENTSAYDSDESLLYVYHSDGYYAGLKALESPKSAAILNNQSITSLSDAKKWNLISGGIQTTAMYGDVVTFVGAGNFSIPAGDSITVGFAMVFGQSLSELLENASNASTKWKAMTGTLATEEEEETTISQYKLDQNYPNPFNPTTTIAYEIPAGASAQWVSLKVFDVLGRQVATLVNERKSAGSYQVTFDASHFASGLYLYRIQAGSYVATRKMLLVK
ncbi:peptidase S8 and S53 subtilisin kexin sedolisin [Chloroherpeton thalassium ATCC 35110]|uniref:Peptidase S8 and S53 subtilisin kexin sedolisin n=2 Tax=Chloroherpeton thalassium TaxID=100716 RepID=B3QV04_CHLT3|nr:peptidase S8 and S53 subtilisin kexin sedolisin [Chloroherpeton thalassium ATCC 35110]